MGVSRLVLFGACQLPFHVGLFIAMHTKSIRGTLVLFRCLLPKFFALDFPSRGLDHHIAFVAEQLYMPFGCPLCELVYNLIMVFIQSIKELFWRHFRIIAVANFSVHNASC